MYEFIVFYRFKMWTKRVVCELQSRMQFLCITAYMLTKNRNLNVSIVNDYELHDMAEVKK